MGDRWSVPGDESEVAIEVMLLERPARHVSAPTGPRCDQLPQQLVRVRRSAAAGLMAQTGGLNSVQTDFNNDGRPDIFVMRGGWEVAMRNSLLRNNPDGTFTYTRRIQVPANLAGRLDELHVVIHGHDIDGNGKYEGRTTALGAPLEGELPVACGQIHRR